MLVPVGLAIALLDQPGARIIEMIHDGTLPIAFDLRRPASKRNEWRIYAGAIPESDRDLYQSILGSEGGAPLPLFRVERILQASQRCVHRLCAAGALRTVPATNASGGRRVHHDSLIAFLRSRRSGARPTPRMNSETPPSPVSDVLQGGLGTEAKPTNPQPRATGA